MSFSEYIAMIQTYSTSNEPVQKPPIIIVGKPTETKKCPECGEMLVTKNEKIKFSIKYV